MGSSFSCSRYDEWNCVQQNHRRIMISPLTSPCLYAFNVNNREQVSHYAQFQLRVSLQLHGNIQMKKQCARRLHEAYKATYFRWLDKGALGWHPVLQNTPDLSEWLSMCSVINTLIQGDHTAGWTAKCIFPHPYQKADPCTRWPNEAELEIPR